MDTWVKNRNVSGANQRWIQIGWKKLKQKSCYGGCRIENRKRESVGEETWWCENSWKLRHPFLGELCKGVPHQPQCCEDGTSKQACARKENKKDNIKTCICPLSFHDILFLSSWRNGLIFHTLFLSSQWLLRGVVANKFLY